MTKTKFLSFCFTNWGLFVTFLDMDHWKLCKTSESIFNAALVQ